MRRAFFAIALGLLCCRTEPSANELRLLAQAQGRASVFARHHKLDPLCRDLRGGAVCCSAVMSGRPAGFCCTYTQCSWTDDE